ncbi:uncharacterized protein SPSC_05327 [Sporisorium scitamineum]|uniref:Uncharacterized protein n=1 Tax=Sporisorium scitamineum TaxID=49012 RepID=A0A127ZH57_9BASI|nr:uncharacterized protein SPSC_05327 [Sporisorium scitamineum]
MKLHLILFPALMLVITTVDSIIEPFTSTRAGLRGRTDLAKSLQDGPPLHWFSEYLSSYSGPIENIMDGNMALTQKMFRFADRVAALDRIRWEVLRQNPALDADERLVLSRPFHNWNNPNFRVDGVGNRVNNPHEFNRMALAFQSDSKTVGEVERLVFDLVSKDLIR